MSLENDEVNITWWIKKRFGNEAENETEIKDARYNIEPVNDDFEEDEQRSNRFAPLYYSPQYYNEKRSYIYPQYDVEKFALVPEAENDEKRDLIKGPSINPIIEENEEIGPNDDWGKEHKMFYDLRPEQELNENARKFSDIEKAPEGDTKANEAKKGKHKKISQKEKEAISAGLIKLLYDWKLHKEQTGSGNTGSGNGEPQSQKKDENNLNKEEGETQPERKHIEGEDMNEKEGENDVKSEEMNEYKDTEENTKNKAFDTNLNDPLKDTKENEKENELANNVKEEEESKEGMEEEGSGEVKAVKSKTKGKINVLVNVNINERSLRSKVSRANKRKQRNYFLSMKNLEDINTEKEAEEDEDEDEDENKTELKNSKENKLVEKPVASNSITEKPTAPKYVNQSNPQPLTYAQTYPVAMAETPPQSNYPAAPQQSYASPNQYNNTINNNNNNMYQAVTATTATTQYQAALPNDTSRMREDEGESSGEDEYEMIEEKIKEDGSTQESTARESSGIAEEKTSKKAPQPAKSTTKQNKQRQIYLPGAMQTVTEKHEKKPKKQGEENGDLNDSEEHSTMEKETGKETENETALSNENNAKLEGSLKTRKHKKRKQHKSYTKTKAKEIQETYSQMEEKTDEKSTATPKFTKPKDNPIKVTKISDNVGNSNRPSEATKEKASVNQKGLTAKTMEEPSGTRENKLVPLKAMEELSGRQESKLVPSKAMEELSGTHESKLVPLKSMEGSGSKDEKVHFVQLHDSEIQLLKEHRAKVQSSEPIVIDDIKKKHEKPKANPKEATILNKTIQSGTKVKSSEKHIGTNNELPGTYHEGQYENRPTTKRNYVTPMKPEVVVPPSKMKTNESLEKKESHEGTHENKNEKMDTKEEGSGEAERKKYKSLKSVRERFKAWEKEMIAKLSNPYLKEDDKLDSEEGSGNEKGEKDERFKSWSQEEKDLISKLANPFLHRNDKKGKGEQTAAVEGGQSKGNLVQKAKNGSKIEDLVKEHLKTGSKENEKVSTAKPQKSETKAAELPIEDNEKNKRNLTTIEQQQQQQSNDKIQSFVPEEESKEPRGQLEGGKISNLNQLEKFKTQIMSEVGKINKLQEEYKKNFKESKELESAKNTLTKDLKFIKDIESKMARNSTGNKTENEEKKVKEEPDKNKKESKGKEGKNLKNAAIGKPAKKKEVKDPLVKIQSLLHEEILRTKNTKKTGKDKQLENIRGLLKQELKKLIISGKLGSPDKLPAGLRKLGKMIHQKLKAAKKKSKKKKKPKKSNNKNSVHGKDLKNSLDLVKEYKPTVPGSNRGYITTMSKYKAAMMALKSLREQQQQAGPDKNDTKTPMQAIQLNINGKNSTQSLNQPNGSPTKPHVVMPDNLPTGAQADQFKELLKNLNKKIGEVYTRLQKNKQPINNNTISTGNNNKNNNANNNNNDNSNSKNNVNQMQQTQNNNIPFPTGNMLAPPPQQMNNNYAAPQMQPIMPLASSYNEPQAKHEMPVEPEVEEKEEPEPDTVLAESEPVETLIENLEKDITDVWSFKDDYPDAGALGLDNDKIHRTYANLGSLSGLSLRRALSRALKGKDVGLAIVGGSISKGGPFSEKGVDYALKTYFYAIADWWNKVIRPVTGSSMLIRDVSIGGIATDYYSYCLRTHLPDDKMTNIVLWELSANDMRRYDETIKPRPQSLEQFTQEVLSYKAKPALIFLNFFALFSWDQDLVTHCRNFEDEGEGEVAKHYKVTSLSWRDMVCSLMQQNAPLFTRDELFAEDKFHPSIEAHAQMAYVVIDYIRTEFLKNLVKQRFLEIGDASRKLKIPDTVYIPKPMYSQTFTWKPRCYTYMVVDNQIPNNTLPLEEEVNGDFHYSVLREFKVRSDKIIGMDTKKSDQFITYNIQVPTHRNGDTTPYKKLAIMSFTDDRQAEIRFDNTPIQKIDTKKTFLEGTVLKYIASNITPGNHKLVVKSGPNGFVISAILLG